MGTSPEASLEGRRLGVWSTVNHSVLPDEQLAQLCTCFCICFNAPTEALHGAGDKTIANVQQVLTLARSLMLSS